MSIYMAVVGTAGTYKQVGRLTLQIPKAVGKAFQIIGRLIGQNNKNGHSDGKKSQKKKEGRKIKKVKKHQNNKKRGTQIRRDKDQKRKQDKKKKK